MKSPQSATNDLQWIEFLLNRKKQWCIYYTDNNRSSIKKIKIWMYYHVLINFNKVNGSRNPNTRINQYINSMTGLWFTYMRNIFNAHYIWVYNLPLHMCGDEIKKCNSIRFQSEVYLLSTQLKYVVTYYIKINTSSSMIDHKVDEIRKESWVLHAEKELQVRSFVEKIESFKIHDTKRLPLRVKCVKLLKVWIISLGFEKDRVLWIHSVQIEAISCRSKIRCCREFF